MRAADSGRAGPVTFSGVDEVWGSLDRRARDRRASTPSSGGGPSGQAALQAEFADLCHDLRQPLTALSILAAGLSTEAELTLQGRRRLHLLNEQVERLSSFLVQFLEQPAPVRVDLGDLAREAVTSIRVDSPGRIELDVDADAQVMGDPVLLSRAIVNVLDNACQAVGVGGAVRLRVSSDGRLAHLDVDDAGGRPDSGPGGHGRGLPIVQAVVSRHGGTVEQLPSELGGMRVRWTLPAVGAPREVAP